MIYVPHGKPTDETILSLKDCVRDLKACLGENDLVADGGNTHWREVWVNRHVMIAVTTMMLVAEAYGFDTAPMEGFDPAGVKREFGVPDEAEVVALLAIGRGKAPDKPYPGRFDIDQIVFRERYGQPWKA